MRRRIVPATHTITPADLLAIVIATIPVRIASVITCNMESLAVRPQKPNAPAGARLDDVCTGCTE